MRFTTTVTLLVIAFGSTKDENYASTTHGSEPMQGCSCMEEPSSMQSREKAREEEQPELPSGVQSTCRPAFSGRLWASARVTGDTEEVTADGSTELTREVSATRCHGSRHFQSRLRLYTRSPRRPIFIRTRHRQLEKHSYRLKNTIFGQRYRLVERHRAYRLEH